MKEIYFIVASIIFISSCTKDKTSQIQPSDTLHNVEVLNDVFDKDSLNINVGDTVLWINNSGFHNVNGTTVTYPANLESFGNSLASAPWTFQYVFNTKGTYTYRCDAHFIMGMIGKVIVN